MATTFWLIIFLSIIITIIWIITLIKQAKNEEWVWFVLTLLLAVPVLIIYWIVQRGKK